MDRGIMESDLTIVVTARNDDHGGNLIQRMQLFVNGLLEQCQRYQLNAELLLVEWNPPLDKPRLAQALFWPVDSVPCRVRIIEVPSEIHQRFKYADRLPLFQMIAKNVGIRRARGWFILTTNIDILFSGDLMHFMASRRLKKGHMYRVDRYDVSADIPLDLPIETKLEYCQQHVIRINDREGTRNVHSGSYHAVYPARTWRSWLHEVVQDWGLRPTTTWSRLHTNACGDFTLMAREHWFALHGYPEFEMYSLHLDSLLCHAAHHGGARERVLRDPMRIYHIEHATGSGWTPEGKIKLNNRLKTAGIPQLDHDQFAAWATQMRGERRPIIFNDETWGLANEDFPETTLHGAMKKR